MIIATYACSLPMAWSTKIAINRFAFDYGLNVKIVEVGRKFLYRRLQVEVYGSPSEQDFAYNTIINYLNRIKSDD